VAAVAPPRRLLEDSTVLVDGPWTHRDVSANGVRLHVAEAGSGPLVVLLHGFPEFWWSWRHQLQALADAGFRAVAPDLRGYAASDKPPRGYDSLTLAADVAGLVRALGERDAVVVGHDWGGHIGWTMAAVHPGVVRRLVAISVPHPLRWLSALPRDGEQRRASAYMARFQLPWHPERWIVADDAANVSALLHAWGGPGFPDRETDRRCRDAMQILAAPHCALEYYRWALRSIPRADGRRYRHAMRRPITAPTLHLHGSADTCVLATTASSSGRYVSGDYEWIAYDGIGHFPHEEATAAVNADLLRWCMQA
jgi:pimeloyl-ACP methyl ester carboxylesterase